MGKKLRRLVVPAFVLLLALGWAIDILTERLPNREFGVAALEAVLAALAYRFGRRGLRQAWGGDTSHDVQASVAQRTTEPAHYSENAIRVISMANSEGGASIGVTLNTLEFALRSDDDQGVWVRFDLHYEAEAKVNDDHDSANSLVVVNPGSDSMVVSATESAVNALEIAEGISSAYGPTAIMPGHLAAGLRFERTRDPDAARWILNEYFGIEFTDLDDVLSTRGPALEEVSWAPPAGQPVGPDTSRTVVQTPRSRGQAGRVFYPLAALGLFLTAFGFMGDLPSIIRDTRAVEAAVDQVGHDNERAREGFLAVVERRPDSVRAHTGVACTYALDGDTDGWALSMQMALFAGHRPSEVSSCLEPAELGRFEVVRTEGGSFLRLANDYWGATFVAVTSLESIDELPRLLRKSSCAYGEAGYTKIGGLHAVGVATSSITQEQFDRESDAVLECVKSWPDSEERDITLRFFGVDQ